VSRARGIEKRGTGNIDNLAHDFDRDEFSVRTRQARPCMSRCRTVLRQPCSAAAYTFHLHLLVASASAGGVQNHYCFALLFYSFRQQKTDGANRSRRRIQRAGEITDYGRSPSARASQQRNRLCTFAIRREIFTVPTTSHVISIATSFLLFSNTLNPAVHE